MYRSKKHLEFIRKQPCIISEQMGSQACHIRVLSDAGIGLKPSDFAIPMTYHFHRMSHDIGEIRFFQKFSINPYEIALYYAKLSLCKKITQEHLEYLKERKSIYERLHQS
tara:strand:- start:837 stop:1166 length:330 start_codon:yes stop_codon:yes gene_type:complete